MRAVSHAAVIALGFAALGVAALKLSAARTDANLPSSPPR